MLRCECGDPYCPVHYREVTCPLPPTQTLYRIDLEDETGMRFCDGCADDAWESGVFTAEREGVEV